MNVPDWMADAEREAQRLKDYHEARTRLPRTVAELVAMLQRLPPNRPVKAERCMPSFIDMRMVDRIAVQVDLLDAPPAQPSTITRNASSL